MIQTHEMQNCGMPFVHRGDILDDVYVELVGHPTAHLQASAPATPAGKFPTGSKAKQTPPNKALNPHGQATGFWPATVFGFVDRLSLIAPLVRAG